MRRVPTVLVPVAFMKLPKILDCDLKSFFDGVEDVIKKKDTKKADEKTQDPSVKKAEQ
jgi:hypothetical protein